MREFEIEKFKVVKSVNVNDGFDDVKIGRRRRGRNNFMRISVKDETGRDELINNSRIEREIPREPGNMLITNENG